MGRKPNQLVLEFFDRGAKLPDGSNRYEHTCKACGERFPKGRIENLMSHIKTRCHAIAPDDRHRALLQSNERPEPEPHDAERYSGLAATIKGHRYPTKLPIGGSRKLTGLEALAEASRQIEHPRKQGHNGAEKTNMIDPSLQNIWEYEMSVDDPQEGRNGVVSPSAPFDSSTFSLPSTSQELSTSPFALRLASPHQTADHSSKLSMIAASANSLEAMMPCSEGLNQNDIKGSSGTRINAEGLHSIDHAYDTIPMSTQQSLQAYVNGIEGEIPVGTAAQASSFLRPIAMNLGHVPRSSPVEHVSSSSRAQRIRGKLSSSRRQEVQSMRKQGACIRCRMLRKTCSGDNPCKTCAAVTSARVWKLECIRTTIVKEFELYHTNLLTSLANQNLDVAMGQVRFEQYPGFLSLFHDISKDNPMRYSVLTGVPGNQETESERNGALEYSRSSETIKILDEDGEDVPAKFQGYAGAMALKTYDEEQSMFMKHTLTLASELSLQKHDKLLAQVLELWTITHIIVDNEMHWQVWLHPAQVSPKAYPKFAMLNGPARISEANNPQSYQLICSQLRSAAEKLAATISKTVLNELEKRLERRDKCRGFETFLVGIVLLSCAEKMSWYYKTFDDVKWSAEWPLDQPPNSYYERGDYFSDFISKLFKMRGILLHIHTSQVDGLLHAHDPSDPLASQWFDAVRLSEQHIKVRQAAEFDYTNSRSLDLKFSSKLLLAPE